VVQECETGVNRWIEIPADGKSAHDLKEPAPGVKLLPKAEGH
jgi:periplasmic copper chaperone A